ncbi:HAD family hydrolase [Gordonia hydrophobica]|uniref:HAD family hydrolase n=1 Tax=Gordonia hydrophobica TaxID=40516 RepID=A0ABZ2U5W7_9ACTN|nr:HAD family hydrolase [Gordonia hydrophobica]MBM7368786.1 hypothetical protein [Gordonia hydrophobica]
MSALVATDLDRTMIYSRAAGARDVDRCVEVYDGAPLSYMTEAAAGLLAALADRTPVVPVTTRTRGQFERIELPGGPFRFAVVSNGGRILHAGENDDPWRRRVVAAAATSATLAEVHADLLTRIHTDWVGKVRVADDLFCYLVVEPSRQPADFLAQWHAWCEPRGWSVSQQGRKIYAMPHAVTKSAAVAHVRDRLIDDGLLRPDAPVLAAGDGRLDADLLTYADRAIRPRHGELEESGWTTDNLRITDSSGIMAGEEILRWFADRSTESSAPDAPVVVHSEP